MNRASITETVRAGIESDAQHGAVVPPLHLSSTFAFEGFDRRRRYDYTRSGNPTRDLLADALSALEGGAGTVVTASGMAAITVTLCLLERGDLLLAPHDGYGGTWRVVRALADKGAFDVAFVDFHDADAVAAAMARSPRMVWIETPGNPLLRLVDVAATVRAARRCGARVVVDNTFCSPALQTPLASGADLVVHSTTKYLNGHSDVVGGAVVAADRALHERLAWWANCLGLTGAPFDAWLTLRGLRTLHARMRIHEHNARALVERLAEHPAVRRVHYPGLIEHPDHALARRQQRGFGGMLAFELADPPDVAVPALLGGLCCFSLAESLGGVESLIAHPATMTHAAMSVAARRAAGIGDGLLRISAGIEAADDLCADLLAGLDRARTASARPKTSALG